MGDLFGTCGQRDGVERKVGSSGAQRDLQRSPAGQTFIPQYFSIFTCKLPPKLVTLGCKLG